MVGFLGRKVYLIQSDHCSDTYVECLSIEVTRVEQCFLVASLEIFLHS